MHITYYYEVIKALPQSVEISFRNSPFPRIFLQFQCLKFFGMKIVSKRLGRKFLVLFTN